MNSGTYLTTLQSLIAELNAASNEKQKKIVTMQAIKHCDRLHFASKGLSIVKHCLFTRHGLCSKRHKGYGLNPNAPLENSALVMMAQEEVASITHSLLLSTEVPIQVKVSPLVRALQTAALILPDPRLTPIQRPLVSIEVALAEHSQAPSGSDLRTYAQMTRMAKTTVFSQAPIKKLLLRLACLAHSQKDFDQLMVKRSIAIDCLKQSTLGLTDLDKEIERHRNPHLSLSEKLKSVSEWISAEEKADLWLIGHGNHFRALFHGLFASKQTIQPFTYGETRFLYRLRSELGSEIFFSPPYTVVIDQHSGELRGEFSF